MDTALSPHWHRVAALRPRLVPQLRLRRQQVRGQRWLLLCHPGHGRSVRMTPGAWQLVARLDGERNVQQLWERHGEDADDAEPPTQDEVIALLVELRQAGLLQADAGADFEAVAAAPAAPRTRSTLLAWRVPLGDPSVWLESLRPLARPLFSRPALLVWCLAVLTLVLTVVQQGPALWAHGQQWLATPRYLLLSALMYLPLKLVHEGAHALAVMRWGGAVRQAGVTLMLGLPVPYVDASAATAFVQRRRRVLVGAAGMMAELSLAALALPLWLLLEDGLARDLAFVTLFITGVSTLLFNANPLQRLDGYFILCDALDLPNLATRSRRWWLQALQRVVLQLPPNSPMAVAPGETPWLAAYAPLSWLVMLTIAALGVAWLGSVSMPLGLAAGALLAWQVGLRPVWQRLAGLRRSALAAASSTRRWRRLGFGAALALAVLLLAPLPQRSVLQGVTWPPDAAQLRSDEDGFVQAVLARDGDPVAAGAPVLALSNPRLQAELERQQARVAALEAEHVGALRGSAEADGRGRAADAQGELAVAQARLAHLEQRSHALQLVAGVAGRLSLPAAADLVGSYVERGRLLGQVLTDAAPTVRLAVPESDAEQLGALSPRVSVRFVSEPAAAHQATLRRDSVGATRRLPSAALSERHGGPIVTEPGDADALQARQPVVLLDVQLDDAGSAPRRLGERAWVRIDAGHVPLALRALRALRREVVRGFHPSQ